MTKQKLTSPKQADALLAELRGLIESARQRVAHAANSTLTMLDWHVGLRIRNAVLREGRAEYGEQIIATLSQQLVLTMGRVLMPRH